MERTEVEQSRTELGFPNSKSFRLKITVRLQGFLKKKLHTLALRENGCSLWQITKTSDTNPLQLGLKYIQQPWDRVEQKPIDRLMKIYLKEFCLKAYNVDSLFSLNTGSLWVSMHFKKRHRDQRGYSLGEINKSMVLPIWKDFKFEEKKEKMVNCWSLVVWSLKSHKVQWVGGEGKRCGDKRCQGNTVFMYENCQLISFLKVQWY